VLVALLLSISSCGIIGFVKGKSINCKQYESIYMDNLPDEVKSVFLATEFNTSRDTLDFEEVILVIDHDQITVIPVTTVIRCYHPLCGRVNENHMTLLKAGYHFKYNEQMYYLKCGNLLSPKIIYNDSLYFTRDYFFMPMYKGEGESIFHRGAVR
jgi:hypothetical protein